VFCQRAVVDAKPFRHAGTEAFDRDVRALRKPRDDLRRLRRFQVEREAALVAVLGVELHRNICPPRITLRRLDLDDRCAEVGEDRRAKGPGHEHREVDNPDARERQPGLSHASPDTAARRSP
jgi:hypothetical protein